MHVSRTPIEIHLAASGRDNPPSSAYSDIIRAGGTRISEGLEIQIYMGLRMLRSEARQKRNDMPRWGVY